MDDLDGLPESTAQAASNTVRTAHDGIVAEIVGETGICGGLIPDREETLWRELAILRSISPNSDPAINARVVFESYGEPWDEDFLNDDGTPSLAALETVHALILLQRQGAGTGAADGAIDDDEDEEFSAQERDIVEIGRAHV